MVSAHDYSWQVQCVSALVDRRTGEPFRWVLGCSSRDDAERTAARVRAEHRGETAAVERRRGTR